MHDHIHDETYKVSCDLVKLHEKFPILHVITNYHDLKNVLWDSTFIESISPDEKKKYLNYDNKFILFCFYIITKERLDIEFIA